VYDSIESGESKRTVEPYFIVFRIRAFYFVAFCRKTNDFRTFRIDRIKSIKVSEQTFIPKTGINAQSYFEGSWGVFTGERTTVTVLLRGNAAKIVLSGKHHPGEEVEKLNDGSVRYKVTTRGIEEIQRWIISFGNEADVVEPVALRENLLQLGRQLTKKYSE
ncbi:MAG: helix-turn-helix transcriptional regulator, partial [Candidatus Zixiibacteriota bacterium]